MKTFKSTYYSSYFRVKMVEKKTYIIARRLEHLRLKIKIKRPSVVFNRTCLHNNLLPNYIYIYIYIYIAGTMCQKWLNNQRISYAEDSLPTQHSYHWLILDFLQQTRGNTLKDPRYGFNFISVHITIPKSDGNPIKSGGIVSYYLGVLG